MKYIVNEMDVRIYSLINQNRSRCQFTN